MDIKLLLSHPKQSGNLQKDGRTTEMVIHHFQLSKVANKYGSGSYPNLEMLADLVVSNRPSSEVSSDTADTFSVDSARHGESDYEDGKVKPKRKRASARQLEALKSIFRQTPFPHSDVRKKLAKELGMTPRSVQIWFQNQRQIARNLVPVTSPSDSPVT